MRTITWYNDKESQQAYILLREKLKPIIEELFPNYELSHFGINRDFGTEEVQIKLHINQIGKIRVKENSPFQLLEKHK